jgi:GR25 family glycosyltransferase involved in LPS biosynthesis
MNSFNAFFEKIYVVTCHDLLERQSHIRSQFNNLNIDFEFRSAVHKKHLLDSNISPSEKSLTSAHLQCIIDSKLNGLEQILICEDDVFFVNHLHELFDAFLTTVPSDWDFLQLGNQFWATHWLRRKKIRENLYRFHWGTGTHCIGVRSNVFEDCIRAFQTMSYPVDFLYYNLFQKYNCYCPEQFLADALSKNPSNEGFKSTICRKMHVDWSI